MTSVFLLKLLSNLLSLTLRIQPFDTNFLFGQFCFPSFSHPSLELPLPIVTVTLNELDKNL